MRFFFCCVISLSLLACDRSADSPPSPPPAAPPREQPARSPDTPRLRIQGPRFVAADGATFQWRGISAFRLGEMVARGREQDAAAFLEWAAARGLTIVRVFTMAHHLFSLSPDEGVAALPRLLEMAGSRKLQVEVVALADTAAIDVDIPQHVRRVGDIVARHGNAALEIANEPVHPTQRREVHDPNVLRDASSAVPRDVPLSLGSIETGEGFAAGTYVTWHVPRAHDPRGWGHVLQIAKGAEFVQKFQKPVVSDEPIGAAAALVPGRRDNEPARFRAAAIVSRLADLGATFHYEGGLQARIPSGRELECFEAWNEAWRVLPPDVEQRGTFGRAGEPGSAVAGFETGAAAEVFERRTDAAAWAVAVGVTRDPGLRPSSGWRIAEMERFPGVVLVTLTRN